MSQTKNGKENDNYLLNENLIENKNRKKNYFRTKISPITTAVIILVIIMTSLAQLLQSPLVSD